MAVIPLYSAKKLNNVVTVSEKGGSFTDPVAAVNSIKDASAANPYLVLIGPGVYNLGNTLVMKPYVTVAGSGQDATVLTGAISSGVPASSAVVSGTDNTAMRDLTIRNTGGAGYSIALHNNSGTPVIHKVTAIASGGTGNYGVYNTFSSPEMTDVTVNASGGDDSTGIYNTSSSPVMTNVTATASGGSENNYGVYNHNSSPAMKEVTVTVSGGTESYGVYNESSSPAMTGVNVTASGGMYNCGVYNHSSTAIRTSSPTMTRVSAAVSGGISGFGMYNQGYANPVVRHCSLDGSSNSIYINGGTTRIMQSFLKGSVSRVSGTLTCVNSASGTGVELGLNCLAP